MGILLLSLGLIALGLGIVGLFKTSLVWVFPLVFYAIFIWISPVFTVNPPVDNYPYEAKVTLDSASSETTIYFSEYKQEANKITISQYCSPSEPHWIDFNNYDVINTPLIIVLLDNDDKFVYKNRITDEVYGGAVNMGTQP